MIRLIKDLIQAVREKKTEEIRGIEWRLFKLSMFLLFAATIALLSFGLTVFGWIGKILLIVSFFGFLIALYELLGRRIIRWIKPLEVGVLVDKFTGRTNEIVKEGIAITLPTDEIEYEDIKMRRKDVVEDYLTIDGSLKLTATIFYVVDPSGLRDFLAIREELENAIVARVQELLQAETGDRYTDEMISEQRALGEQLRVEMKGSDPEIWIGRLNINRRKIADIQSDIQINNELIQKLEKALEGKPQEKKDEIKQKKIEEEAKRDENIKFMNRRINISAELIENLLLYYEKNTPTKGELKIIELSLDEIPFEESRKEWKKKMKELLEGVEPRENIDRTEGRKTGLEKEFQIEIKGVRLYNPELDAKAKEARDAKVAMKYKQQAVITEYQTTKQTLRLLKEQLPSVSDKELLDYVLAIRGKMNRNKDEKIYDIPGIKEAIPLIVEAIINRKEK